MRRHEYSVLETIKLLHGEHTGTGPMIGEEYRDRLAWLRWRVSEAWEPNLFRKSVIVEEAIRDLARKVLAFAERPAERWRQDPTTTAATSGKETR